MKSLVRTTCLLATASLAVACGGEGKSEPGSPPPAGANPQDIVAIGPIANFGSIVVNGVRYDTDSATFMLDGEPGSQSDLAVGHVVAVSGSVDANGTTGTATSVFFDDLVKGPVQSIDAAGQALTVLGQVVRVGADTSFDDSFSPASLDGISVGQIVEVSGQFDANDDIAASRIEPKPAGTEFEVHGTVASLDSANTLFSLGALTVDYGAALLDDFAGRNLAEGDFVEAKGTTLGANGELVATKVELENRLPGANDGDFVELEGFITRFASPADFDVNGQPVSTSASTRFEGGTSGDLGLNIKVEVDGRLNADGVIEASKVDIRRARAVRVTATVDSANGASNSLVLLGITVNVDALTRMEDKSDADLERLTVADLNAGDYLEVRGTEFPAGSGEILAGRLEREDPDEETELQGFVESVSEPVFTILGVTIETNGQTEFRDANDAALSANEFFARLETGSLVKAEGVEVSGSTLVAREVEFEREF